ncbi:protein ACCELERATED CELL DEATH 6-like [Salvia splendens]|uniref:protein ACCELERATED CELL DEATH 6-like n=1 Tax=Salvia splendens TaxID=180675 RepID=UPI001C252FDA|nr:protein ACCELERATED CELL DEATH 6-like [Salvia splendens]
MNPEFIGRVLEKIASRATTFSTDEDDQLSFWKHPIYWCILKIDMKPQSLDIENQTILGKQSIYVRMVFAFNRFHEKKLIREKALELAIIAAAESGNNDVVEEIVRTLPVAIHTRNYLNQNFLHVAVKNRCEKGFNLIYRTSNYRINYSQEIDNSCNSILHLAARLAPPIKLNLVGYDIEMKLVNFLIHLPGYIQIRNGEAAEMIFTREHRELKIEGEKWMKDTANSCTITAALIATVVFAAAITVPGGNQSESGYPMLYKSSAFTIFAISDAVSLFTSCYVEQDFLYALPKRLCIGLLTLFLSFLFMMVAFSPTLYLVFGQKKAWILLLVGALTCLPISSFVLLQFQLLRDVISTTFGRRIFGKQSDRPFH